MSSISLVLTGAQPHIGICPDPHLPPKLLASLVKDLRLPLEASIRRGNGTQTASMSPEHLLNLLSETAERESAAPANAAGPETKRFDANENVPRAALHFDSDAMVAAFAEFLRRLVKTLNQSVEVVTVVMGEVNHVVLVLPPAISAPARDRLAHVGELLSPMKVSTVPYHASVMLHYGNGKIPTAPLIDLRWDSALCVGCRSFPDGDSSDMARLGRDSVLPSGSLDTWHTLAHRWLTESARNMIPDHSSWTKTDAREFRQWAAETSPRLCQAVLRNDPSFPLVFGGWKHDLSQDHMAELRAMLLVAPTNFLRASLRDKGVAGPGAVFVSHGSTLRWPAVRESLRRVLAEFGRSGESGDSDANAALGAFQLVQPPPCVPYDCGVLIRPVGQKEGTGTLVMVRGAPADAEATSRAFCLPRSQSEDLEVLFYTRCVDFDSSQIEYHFAGSSVRFAPAHDHAGKTNFCATMTLRTDANGRVNAVRTIMHDKISGKSYEFPALPFTGGTADAAVIGRGKRHAAVEQWCEKIRTVSNPDAKWTVQDWRKALDPRVLLARDRYLFIIFGFETLLGDHDRFIHLKSCPPEQVQEQVRVHVHGQMMHLANRIGKSHVGQWCKKYPRPERTDALARDFKNSVYQDAVQEKELLDQAGNLARNYDVGCSDPYSLNVDWDKNDLPF